MSSLVLARKWRPNSFDTMVGQTHAVQALKNALNANRLHHAYLFTGTHGVGKTSIARLFAKALSCQKGVTANPCGECDHCKDIESGRFVDLLEIDAASRSKVEDTREILDNVLYPPNQGHYKIYLIDEVHMLSGHSFNALLKTLEEPPEHVKFLLATTEPKKLPITVLSRCLQFHLKNISQQEMSAHLINILQKETIPYEPIAVSLIAQSANGSVRDALSLLDQAIARGNNNAKEEYVREMLGCVDEYYVIQLVEALAQKDGAKILSISADIQSQGIEPNQLLKALQKLFHQLTIIQCVPNYIEASETSIALAKTISAADLQLFYQIALKGFQDLSLAPTPWIALEMTLLRMLAFQPGNDQSIVQPISRANNYSTLQNTPILEKPVEKAIPPEVKKPVSDNSANSTLSWESILSHLKLTGMANTAAQHCAIKALTDAQLILNIPAQYATSLTDSIQKQIEEALKNYFLQTKQKNRAILFESSDAAVSSPAAKQKAKEKVVLDDVQNSFDQDPNLNKILEVFRGTIVPDSVKPISS